ncbi:MAG: outer membrane beta-barrel protein [Bacteroidia bacterium]
MGENSNIDKLFRSAMEPINIAPPDRAKFALDAELEKRRSGAYKKKINNYRMLAAVLALLLVSFTAFYIAEPSFKINETNNNSSVINKEVNKKDTEKTVESSKSIVDENTHLLQNKNNDKNSELPDRNNLVAKENSDELNIDKSIYSLKESKDNKIRKEEKLNNNYTTDHSIANVYYIKADISPIENKYTLPDKINLIPQSAVNADENFVNTKIPVSLFVFYSPHYSYCLLKDNTPDVVDDVQMYKDQETPEFSYSTGFALRYNLSERWGVSAGVTYSTVIKSISLLKVYAEGTEDNMYYAYHTSSGMIELPNPENVVIHPGDSLNLQGEGEKILKFVHVPILARYMIPKEKINWFINGGLSVNFLVQDQVRISTADSDETVKNKTQGLKKMSYGFVIGAGVEYKLFDNINLVFEPVYKGTFTSITEDAAVKNYPHSMGVNMGASIRF